MLCNDVVHGERTSVHSSFSSFLCYWTNKTADMLLRYGFDEASKKAFIGISN